GVIYAVNKPRNISYKGLADLVTEQNEWDCYFGRWSHKFFTWLSQICSISSSSFPRKTSGCGNMCLRKA
ncbi:hypothetical protein MKX03_032587, partial [Papaver bracteatum]